MRLPRRVPWIAITELEQVCSNIYADEIDIDAKKFAINRISAWRSITSLPHALESTLALLIVIVHDAEDHGYYPQLLLRQSYAAAILRLVNGLVDPLQVGTYARSIAAIAHQLDLPNWLVELRHAATHEDLPSIDLLREGARQSMAWMLHNYYLPILNPPPVARELQVAPLRPLLPILKLYKEIVQIITGDVSAVPKYRSNLISVLRDLERWIAESKLAANVAVGEVGWTSKTGMEGNTDTKELWALEAFCDGLLEKGMLVPFSKNKQQVFDTLLLTKTSSSLWEPLLRHVQFIHPQFPDVFCQRLLSILISRSAEEDPDRRPDPTYDNYLACWVLWSVETWGGNSSEDLNLRRNALSNLIKGIFSSSLKMKPPLRNLLKALSAGQADLESWLAILSRQMETSKTAWDPQNLSIMTERQQMLQSTLALVKSVEASSQHRTEVRTIDIPGWRILDDGFHWESCPIGVFHPYNPNPLDFQQAPNR